MKMKPSLKIYLLVMMLFTGAATIIAMSVVSANYFLAGIDMPMSHHMRAEAFAHKVTDGHPVKIRELVIASRWQDLPAAIKNKLKLSDVVENQLLKSIDGNPLFSQPQAGYFVMKLSKNGETRFIATLFDKPLKQTDNKRFSRHFIDIILIAIAAMLMFSLVPYLILRQVTKPIAKLMAWTKTLQPSQLAKPTPDFHYNELNSLANLVQSSLKSVQETLHREQEFLGYASHELRTPIAVTRSNSELLRKMIDKSLPVEKQLQVVERIERAALTMTDLTETLLWLNRQSDKSLPNKNVHIGKMAEQLLDELSYLVQDKQIDIELEIDDSSYPLPEALCRIVITNLIRNAIQHTQQGIITIKQSDSYLNICNQDSSGHEIKDELGFGLGLELTKRLVQHYGWQYSNVYSQNGHYVEIDFTTEQDAE